MNKKIFLTLFILLLVFPSLSKANNISEFEIEGMTVGDSLLKYYKKKLIDEEKFFNYDSTEMYSFYQTKNLKIYDEIEVNFKNKDNKYIIQAIAGIEHIGINECLKKKKIITDELNSLFNSISEDYIHEYDNNYLAAGTNKTFTSISRAHVSDWDLSNGDMVRVWCSEWGDDVKKENNWNNELHVKIQNSTWMNFLKKQ